MENEKANQDPSKKKKNSQRSSSGVNSYLNYAGMGFQMLAIIVIFYWAGSKLDQRSANEKPFYTAILSLLGVFVGLYTVLKDFIGKKDDQED